MIKINKWWEVFENAGSRKLVNIRHFSSPAGTDSKGYRKLIRQGNKGLAAFGTFQALCQLMATLGIDARKQGSMINSDGSPLDILDLEDLTRIPKKDLTAHITLLTEVDWIQPIQVIDNESPPNDLPSPANDLPPIPQDTPDGEERRGEEGKGGEDNISKKEWKADEYQLRFNALFNRRPTTRWNDKELKAYKAIDVHEDDLSLIEKFHAADTFHRTALLTLLNNWNTEIDRANAWISKPQQPQSQQMSFGQQEEARRREEYDRNMRGLC